MRVSRVQESADNGDTGRSCPLPWALHLLARLDVLIMGTANTHVSRIRNDDPGMTGFQQLFGYL